jgi:hypothetical protein
MRHQHVRRVRDQRHRREVGREVVVQPPRARYRRRIERDGGEEQRAAVGLGLGHDLGAEMSLIAWTVLEPVGRFRALGQARGHDARDAIRNAAAEERDHEAHGLRGSVAPRRHLRVYARGCGKRSQQARQPEREMHALFHG